ncbi:hypothetical protein NQ317_007274 [Molorchus minor]|uniref:Adenosine kinase n=1 Tax=Molorchus minor TaxID=1323400 RepID=A0ABQ9JV08_9CUCU|nr:hypothetical protein NQ317_007274 [Molorchus minor]
MVQELQPRFFATAEKKKWENERRIEGQVQKEREEEGAPLVDIIVNVDCDFLKKYNLKPDTAIRSKPELEGIFQEILQNDPILQPGDSAFLIEPHLSIVMELVKHFLENKKIIIFNLAASFLCEYYPEEVMYLFENSDLVFGNDSEYTAFGKIFKVPANTNKDLLSSINAHFDKKPIRTLVMTRGKKSIFVLSNTLIKEFKTTHLEEDKIVDTDGAGDAFVGGYLAQFVRNKSIQDCVKCGMWAAKEIIQNHGCNFDNKKVYGL